jgi:hypothetical protein
MYARCIDEAYAKTNRMKTNLTVILSTAPANLVSASAGHVITSTILFDAVVALGTLSGVERGPDSCAKLLQWCPDGRTPRIRVREAYSGGKAYLGEKGQTTPSISGLAGLANFK